MLTEMIQSHSVGDFCIIGPRGCGKSAAVAKMAHMLGYQTEPILVYQVCCRQFFFVMYKVMSRRFYISFTDVIIPLLILRIKGKFFFKSDSYKYGKNDLKYC